MNKAIDKIISGAGTIVHSLVVPLFVLVFTIYYRPSGLYGLLDMDNASFAFNATMLFCIVLVSVSITRGWLYLIGKYRKFTSSFYLMWCLAEVLVASLFSSLYIVLMSEESLSFFEISGSAYINMLGVTVYPYLFLFLVFELYSRDKEDARPADDNSLIRFYDEYKKLKQDGFESIPISRKYQDEISRLL